MTSEFKRDLASNGLLSEDIATVKAILGLDVGRFDSGDHLIEIGEQPLRCHLILEGWAFRYKRLRNGRRQILAILLPGDLSEMNLFVMTKADHSIACLTPVTAIKVATESLSTFFSGQHPRIAQALWTKSLLSACIQREWILNLGQRTAPERIGHVLCELYHRLDSAGLTDGNKIPFPLIQADLADATGLSLVHVNKRLNDLRLQGLITFGGKVVSILDLPALEHVSLFSGDYLRTGHDPFALLVDNLRASRLSKCVSQGELGVTRPSLLP